MFTHHVLEQITFRKCYICTVGKGSSELVKGSIPQGVCSHVWVCTLCVHVVWVYIGIYATTCVGMPHMCS